MFSININLITVGVTIVVIIILGIIVFLSNRKSITNKTFLYFSLVAVLYTIFNYVNYQLNSPELVLWAIRLTIFFSVWYSFYLFQFFYVFPKEKISFSKQYKFILLPLVILTSILTLTPFVFSGLKEFNSPGKVSNPEPAMGVILFGLVVVFLVVTGIVFLVRKTMQAQNAEKKQLTLVLIGTFITYSCLIFFNLIMTVVFGNVAFISLAPIFTIPFIVFTTYAILKQGLFNIKVIATQLITFSLWIFILVRTLIATSLQEAIINGILFLITVVVGILLIRSVLREVRQREEMERMAEDVRRAYVVEKKAKEELEKLDKVKDQFLAQAQHDLRTPLTSIMGYTDLLLSGTFGKQSKKTTEVVKKLQLLTNGMIRKANNFLDLAQFQLGKSPLTLKPRVQPFSILEEIKGELDFKAESRGIYLHLEEPKGGFDKNTSIEADREKLKAAIFNIVDNSVKYTPQGGVTIEMRHDGENKVLIEVKDTGIGIDKEKVKTIFDTMFDRSEAAKKTAAGAGVGLYLSTQIIKGHHGRVWAESEGEGKGSTFYVELPLSLQPNLSPPANT